MKLRENKCISFETRHMNGTHETYLNVVIIIIVWDVAQANLL